MPSITSPDNDAAVRIVVTPAQSSYFAGEPLSVSITFTNTRTIDSPTISRSLSHSHKRGAHSISSAPLSKPPTSPRTPRAPLSSVSYPKTHSRDVPDRRGLIGKASATSDDLSGLVEQRRKRLLGKSLSVSIAPTELENNLGIHSEYVSPTSPQVSSPLSRIDSLVLASNHPHVRKDSLLDGQLNVQEMLPPTTPFSSSSTLSLSSISETQLSSYPPTPTLLQTPSLPPFLVQPNGNGRHTRRQSIQIGLGQPKGWGKPNLPPPRTAFSSTFPQTYTELVLYSYAQLTGSMYVTPLPSSQTTPDQAYTLNRMRTSLRKRKARGGGSMDISSSIQSPPSRAPPPHRRSHSRTSSISSGLMSLLSPTSSIVTSVSSPPALASSWNSTSTPSRHRPSPSVGLGISLNGTPPSAAPPVIEEDIDPEAALPVFDVQPSMLAVDLALSPGESKSYTYTIPLPPNLPPTFRGKVLRISYELVVGMCRAGNDGNNYSKVMKVPIRMYNYVAVGIPPSPYDMLWPVNKTNATGKVIEETGISPQKTFRKSPLLEETFDDMKQYARRLLASFPDPHASGVRIKLPVEAASAEDAEGNLIGSPKDDWRREREQDGLTGCREAVEVLTRNPKKASYDVNKDGVKVAVLTFTKSAYRLGETISGIVEINERQSRARVLQMSAILESQESLPSSIASSKPQQLRRIHAEHHSSFTRSTLRTSFALDIPSDASPSFQVNVYGLGSVSAPGGLNWKVRLCLLVSVANMNSNAGTEGVRIRDLVREGSKGEWGTSWSARKNGAPMEKPPPPPPPSLQRVHARLESKSWTAFFTDTLLGPSEPEYHDGDEHEDDNDQSVDEDYDGIKADREGGVGVGVNFGNGDDGWEDLKVEMVECEIPINVWPGNTAFKALDVIFDV